MIAVFLYAAVAAWGNVERSTIQTKLFLALVGSYADIRKLNRLKEMWLPRRLSIEKLVSNPSNAKFLSVYRDSL